MKKILFLLVALLALSSCGTPKYMENSYTLNLKEFTGDDFTINPTSVANGEFEPLGIVEEYFYFGNKVDKEHKTHVEEVKDKYMQVSIFKPTQNRMFEKIISNAKEIGANGIIEFKMVDLFDKNMRHNGYKLSGVAVKYKK